MSPNPWTATTRTTRSVHVPIRRAVRFLSDGHIIESPETGLQYRIERLIGEGGFGQAFLATRVSRSSDVPAVVCIKVSERIDGWLREAYFAQLLDNHPRAVRLFDAFPLKESGRSVAHCLAIERQHFRSRIDQAPPAVE